MHKLYVLIKQCKKVSNFIRHSSRNISSTTFKALGRGSRKPWFPCAGSPVPSSVAHSGWKTKLTSFPQPALSSQTWGLWQHLAACSTAQAPGLEWPQAGQQLLSLSDLSTPSPCLGDCTLPPIFDWIYSCWRGIVIFSIIPCLWNKYIFCCIWKYAYFNVYAKNAWTSLVTLFALVNFQVQATCDWG